MKVLKCLIFQVKMRLSTKSAHYYLIAVLNNASLFYFILFFFSLQV